MSKQPTKKTTAISEAEAKTMDRSKMGVGVVAAPQGEVEGQAEYYTWVVTPYGHYVRILYDTEVYHWYVCGVCGEYFRA